MPCFFNAGRYRLYGPAYSGGLKVYNHAAT